MTPKLVLSFFSAYSLNVVLHEVAHAVAAYGLGMRSTVYHYYANIDLANSSTRSRALVAAAGPIFSLLLGLSCWWCRGAIRIGRFGPLLLYGAVFGVSIFFGNLMSASFVGDFGTVARLLEFDATSRHSMTIAGLVLLPVFMCVMGSKFLPWASHGASWWRVQAEVIVVPAIFGTLLVILAFLPMPTAFVLSWITTSVFWVFAAIGVFVAARRNGGGEQSRLPAERSDYIVAAGVLLLVRVLVNGIAFSP